MRWSASPALLLVLTTACWPFGKKHLDLDTGPAACEQILGSETTTLSTTGDTARMNFAVPYATRSFLVSARSNTGGTIYLTELEDPDGNDPLDIDGWVSQTTYLTSAVLPFGDETAFNWPVRDIDPAPPYGYWSLAFSVLDSNGSPQEGVNVDVTIHLNQDFNTDSGCLSVRVLMTPDVAEDPELVAAIESAVGVWQDIYAGADIQLQPIYETAQGMDTTLSHPSSGSDAYLALKEAGDDEELVLVIGESIDGTNNGILGEAGAIPGALAPSTRGVVAIAWLMHAGSDGVLDDTDIQGLGETMAHEMGHYLGLFHPVELDGSGNPSGYSDALDDTPMCSTSTGCTASLGTNLMFPYRTCTDSACERQDDLTEQQRAVMQRYSGTR
ncbi:MAG: hypothetical protein GXP62_17880 [Oligoflexia bacterium]|nr:hypothetical protein [Oligoflexia bacterium]